MKSNLRVVVCKYTKKEVLSTLKGLHMHNDTVQEDLEEVEKFKKQHNMTTYYIARAGEYARFEAETEAEAVKLAEADYNRPRHERVEDWKESEYMGDYFSVTN